MAEFPSVQGRCPACGSGGTLFVGAGGFLTCSLDRCPEPAKASDLLDRPDYHVIELGEGKWALQHEATCFPNLLDCTTHAAIAAWMDTLTGPPAPPGRYRVNRDLSLTALVVSDG